MSSEPSKVAPKKRGIRGFFGRRSLSLRLAFLFLALFGGTFAVFSAFLYEAFERTQQSEFDAALYNYAVDVVDSIEVDLYGELSLKPQLLSDRGKIFPFTLGKAFFEIRGYDGKILARSRNLGQAALPFDPSGLARLANMGAQFRSVPPHAFPKPLMQSFGTERTPYRMITYLVDRPTTQKIALQIAVPETFLQRERAGLRTFLLIAVPLVMLAAVLISLILSRRAFRPVSAMIDKAREISASRLSERLPVPEVDDELQRLALTVNQLLGRLEQAFQSQERFVADASHQLRTPLAVLKGELGVLRSRTRSPEEIEQFFDSAGQEIDELSRTVTNLLTLARVDAGVGALQMGPVRLDEIAIDVVSRLKKLADAKQIQLRLNVGEPAMASGRTAFEVRGDADLLAALVNNLVDNAIKYSPPQSLVEVEVDEHAGFGRLRVSDQGPGIPAGEREKVFERFRRLTGARVSGSGLGLAIARQIVDVHQGRISIQDRGERWAGATGACFSVEIPRDAT